MYRVLLLSFFFLFTALTVNAQRTLSNRKDSVAKNTSIPDTVKPAITDTTKKKYINKGKIEGRRAFLSSLMVPGLGQIRNGVTVYRLVKVAGIYTGGTLLALSYIDNNKNYQLFYNEIIYQRENKQASPDFPFPGIDEAGLITAKDTYRRNREVIIFSFIGLYLLNAVEAYIDARLKYFDVGDENIAFKITPDLINTNTMYGFNPVTPGVKLTLSF